jgi:hypothetical protein
MRLRRRSPGNRPSLRGGARTFRPSPKERATEDRLAGVPLREKGTQDEDARRGPHVPRGGRAAMAQRFGERDEVVGKGLGFVHRLYREPTAPGMLTISPYERCPTHSAGKRTAGWHCAADRPARETAWHDVRVPTQRSSRGPAPEGATRACSGRTRCPVGCGPPRRSESSPRKCPRVCRRR